MLQAKLVVVGGDTKTDEIQLKHLPAIVGRSREANIKLPHPLVSRNHCELYENDGRLHVRDLGSLNGTYVGSSRVAQSAVLDPDGLLTIGTVTFRAIYTPAQASTNGASTNGASTNGASTNGEHPPQRTTENATQPAGAQPAGAGKRVAIGDEPDTRPQVQRPTVVGDGRPAAQPVPFDLTETQPAPIVNVTRAADRDTDPSLLDFDPSLFDDIGSQKITAVESRVSIEDSQIGPDGSISLSAIDRLPQPPGQLSFSGGIQDDEQRSAAELVAASRIIVEASAPQTGAEPQQSKSSDSSRPR